MRCGLIDRLIDLFRSDWIRLDWIRLMNRLEWIRLMNRWERRNFEFQSIEIKIGSTRVVEFRMRVLLDQKIQVRSIRTQSIRWSGTLVSPKCETRLE